MHAPDGCLDLLGHANKHACVLQDANHTTLSLPPDVAGSNQPSLLLEACFGQAWAVPYCVPLCPVLDAGAQRLASNVTGGDRLALSEFLDSFLP